MKSYFKSKGCNFKFALPPIYLLCSLLLIFFTQCGPTSQSSHTAQAIGRVRITYGQAELHRSITGVQDFPKLVQPMNTIVRKGDVVELLDIIPTGGETPFYYKIKTAQGEAGYAQTYVEPLEPYSDRGAALFVYLQAPYEYECVVEEVDKMILKYNKFINEYPKSKYVPSALRKIAGLHRYTLQCQQSDAHKKERIMKINKIFSILLEEVFKKDNAALAVDIIKKCELKAPNFSGKENRHDEYDFYTFDNYTTMVVDSLMARIFPSPLASVE